MTCRTCANWTMKSYPLMARQGFGNCNLQTSKAVFYPPHHNCDAHKAVTQAQQVKRDAWMKGIRL